MPRHAHALLAIGVTALGAWWLTASAAERSLGAFRDWTAVEFGKGGEACMMWSQPGKRSGGGGRGDAFVFVTHRPGEGMLDRVTLELGYPVAASTRVAVTIRSDHFDLAASGTGAWTRNSDEDRALIAAMRAGRTMVIEGTTKAGARISDSYSLQGFTAAYKAIGKACNVP